MTLVTLGLLFLAAVLAGGIVLVALRAFDVFRAVRGAGGAVTAELGGVSRSLERLAESAEKAAAGGESAAAATDRLGRSLARLRLLRRTLDRSREQVEEAIGLGNLRK